MADISPIIETALENHLLTIPGLPEVAYEGVPFEPTQGQSYLEVLHIPTIREPATRGSSFQTYYQGIFRVICKTPSDIGAGPASSLAAKVIEAFEANKDIAYNGKIITTRYASKENGSKEGAFYVVPVNVGWYIYD